jgi:hypothetical protein
MSSFKLAQAALLSVALAASAGAICSAQTLSGLTMAPPRGFALKAALTPDGDGVRARGQLCRVSGVGPWPSRVKLDLLSVNGDVVSGAVSTIGPISAHKTGCVAYTVQAPWTPETGQTVRLSAT